MIYLYLADTSFLQNDVSFLHCKQFVSKDALQKVERYKNNASRTQSLGGALLATVAGSLHSTNNVPCKIAYGANGKPFFSNCTNLSMSISHTKHFALCAIAEQMHAPLVGIDIELARSVPLALAKKCFTKEELNFVNDFDESCQNFYKNFALDSFEKRFLYLWTKKESYIKATGEGLAVPLASVSFCPMQQNCNANNFASAKSFVKDAFNAQNICKKNNLHFIPFLPMQVLQNDLKTNFFTQSYLLTGQDFDYGFISLTAKLANFAGAFDCTIKEIDLSQYLGLQ